jgi:hypothetical protein
MRGQSRPRVLTIAFSIVLLSLASLVGGMTANELNAREGCTTEMQIRVWQGSVEVKHSCPTVQQPSNPRSLQPAGHACHPEANRALHATHGRRRVVRR